MKNNRKSIQNVNEKSSKKQILSILIMSDITGKMKGKLVVLVYLQRCIIKQIIDDQELDALGHICVYKLFSGVNKALGLS